MSVPACERARSSSAGQRVERLGRPAERADAKSGLVSPLEEVGDPAQELGRLVSHSL